MLESTIQDFRFGLRTIKRSPRVRLYGDYFYRPRDRRHNGGVQCFLLLAQIHAMKKKGLRYNDPVSVRQPALSEV